MCEKVLSHSLPPKRYRVEEGKLMYDPQVESRKMSNFKWRIVVPKEGRLGVLRECHDNPKATHLGIQKTVDRVMERYYWPGLTGDVKKYVRECKTCKMSKTVNVRPSGLAGKYRKAHNPWQMVSMDILGPFPGTK